MNILFYGTYNHFASAPSNSYDYWSDALSQNRQLQQSHFNSFHKYRLEWEPPSELHGDGYLHWYLDEDLVYAINGSSITDVTKAEIPSEPSSIIFNTAVSKDWGFPQECPEGCTCKGYNCHSDEYNYKCGFNPGFCNMLANDGALMKVNYVRVYQDPNNSLHKVGCSTPERPTRKWIEGHESVYKREGDAKPLKGVPRGGGACTEGEDSCGGQVGGICKSGRCACQPGRTGPQCLSVDGYDNVIWDPSDSIDDIGFYLPQLSLQYSILILVFVVLGTVVLAAGIKLKSKRMHYTRIDF